MMLVFFVPMVVYDQRGIVSVMEKGKMIFIESLIFSVVK